LLPPTFFKKLCGTGCLFVSARNIRANMSTRKRSNKRNHRSGSAPDSGPKTHHGSHHDTRQENEQNPAGNDRARPRREPSSEAGRPAEPGRPPEAVRKDSGQKDSGNWLYGIHAVVAALANPKRKCNRLLVTAEVLRRMETELREIVPSSVFVEKTDRGTISALLPAESVHQGIALDCERLPVPALEDVLAKNQDGDSIIVVLDQITDPHNVGAILRSAAGFGAHAVIMHDRNAPPSTGTLAKSASGALELIPLIRVTNLARTLEQLARADYWRIGLEGTAEQTLAQSQPGKRTALVMGAEGSGLRRLTAEKCDQLCRLPMVEAARLTSLNVSNAAAIALYELVRA
jgi:23S rRNA (guanosine2251-2'-O)-methyltransferase